MFQENTLKSLSVQVFNIIEGWANYVLNLKTIEAKRKASICNDCLHKKYTGYEVIQDNSIKEIQGFICNKCKCPLSAKLRSNSKCPLKKF